MSVIDLSSDDDSDCANRWRSHIGISGTDQSSSDTDVLMACGWPSILHTSIRVGGVTVPMNELTACIGVDSTALLSDAIIDAYIAILRTLPPSFHHSSVVLAPCHLSTKIAAMPRRRGARSVKNRRPVLPALGWIGRWLRGTAILDAAMTLFPICADNHWTVLALLNPAHKVDIALRLYATWHAKQAAPSASAGSVPTSCLCSSEGRSAGSAATAGVRVSGVAGRCFVLGVDSLGVGDRRRYVDPLISYLCLRFCFEWRYKVACYKALLAGAVNKNPPSNSGAAAMTVEVECHRDPSNPKSSPSATPYVEVSIPSNFRCVATAHKICPDLLVAGTPAERKFFEFYWSAICGPRSDPERGVGWVSFPALFQKNGVDCGVYVALFLTALSYPPVVSMLTHADPQALRYFPRGVGTFASGASREELEGATPTAALAAPAYSASAAGPLPAASSSPAGTLENEAARDVQVSEEKGTMQNGSMGECSKEPCIDNPPPVAAPCIYNPPPVAAPCIDNPPPVAAPISNVLSLLCRGALSRRKGVLVAPPELTVQAQSSPADLRLLDSEAGWLPSSPYPMRKFLASLLCQWHQHPGMDASKRATRLTDVVPCGDEWADWISKKLLLQGRGAEEKNKSEVNRVDKQHCTTNRGLCPYACLVCGERIGNPEPPRRPRVRPSSRCVIAPSLDEFFPLSECGIAVKVVIACEPNLSLGDVADSVILDDVISLFFTPQNCESSDGAAV